VVLSKGGQEVVAHSEDVSLSGLFVRMDMPIQERWLVRLLVTLPPEKDVLVVMGMAARQTPAKNGLPPGVGIQLYALTAAERKRWEAFITWVSTAPPQEPAAPVAGAEVPPKAAQRQYPRHAAVLQVKLQTVDDLQLLYTRNVSKGGLFVGTTLEIADGTPMKVSVIHPRSGEQFELEAVVRWRGAATEPGLGLEFVKLTDERRDQFLEFIKTEIPVEQHLYRAEGDGRLSSIAPPEGAEVAASDLR
jgi:hypothetical protein